jgi:hypothetical protein
VFALHVLHDYDRLDHDLDQLAGMLGSAACTIVLCIELLPASNRLGTLEGRCFNVFVSRL